MPTPPTAKFLARLVPLIAPVVVITVVGASPNGDEPTRMLRTPSVSATHVAFAYANNI